MGGPDLGPALYSVSVLPPQKLLFLMLNEFVACAPPPPPLYTHRSLWNPLSLFKSKATYAQHFFFLHKRPQDCIPILFFNLSPSLLTSLNLYD